MAACRKLRQMKNRMRCPKLLTSRDFPLFQPAVLAMLAEAMIPEAFENAPPFIGLITVLGFLAAYLIAQH